MLIDAPGYQPADTADSGTGKGKREISLFPESSAELEATIQTLNQLNR